MREVLPVASISWLSSPPITIPNPASILSGFLGGSGKVVRFKGPHRFYRAAGWDTKNNAMASAYGGWWVDEAILSQIGNRIQQFEGWLPPNSLHQAWPAHYRGMTALCEDWNDMREMYKLDLPPGEEIIGLVGPTAPQPRLSTLNANSRATPMFRGEGEQVYFKRTRNLNSINPLWIYPIRLW
jgi:hypothetical protein